MTCAHEEHFPIQILQIDATTKTADWCIDCGCVRYEDSKDWLEPAKTQ